MSERFPISQRTRATVRKFRLRSHEFDFFNYSTVDMVKYETDFLGDTIDATLAAGGAGTAAAVVSAQSGQVALATGAVDNQCSTLYLPGGNFLPDNNPVMAVRFYVDSVATGNVQLGFVDSAAAGVLGATGVGPIVSPLTTTPTLTGSTANCVVATYDLSSGLTNPSYWRMAGSRASTTWLVTPTTTNTDLRAPTASTYQWLVLRICRSERGATDQTDAILEINGVEVARKSDGAIQNTPVLWPFVLIGATSAASRTLSIDYLGVWQDRDINA